MTISDGRSVARGCIVAGWLSVALVALSTAAPVDAKPGVWQGKNVTVSGVPGCDCTVQDAKECWCTIP